MSTEALSLSKLWTAHAVSNAAQDRRELLGEAVTIQPSDKRPGGFLQYVEGWPKPLLYGSVLQAMLRVSDTTGQRAVVRMLGGPIAANTTAQARPSPGTPLSTMIGLEPVDPNDPTAEALFYSGGTTPYLAALTLGAALRDPVSREALGQGIFSYGLRRNLPDDTRPAPGYLALLARVQQEQ
jgi:hypothetical protein